MNQVNLIGRLTADPELKRTQSGTAMVRFSIAVDRAYTKQGEERQADFISCVAWDKKAEFICKYFSKGQMIVIEGAWRTGSYKDKDGNTVYTNECVIGKAEFCGSKSESVASSDTPADTSKQDTADDDFVDVEGAATESIPFF